MRQHRLGTAVMQYVSDLRSLAVPVDRHAVRAEPLRRIARLEEREVIAQHHGNGVPRRNAERRKPARRPPRPLHDRLARDLAIPADHPAGRNLCHAPLPCCREKVSSPAAFTLQSTRLCAILPRSGWAPPAGGEQPSSPPDPTRSITAEMFRKEGTDVIFPDGGTFLRKDQVARSDV